MNMSKMVKFDRLNPQNNLSKLSLQQKLLGNASKVNFNVKPITKRQNQVTTEPWKLPAPNRKCASICKILTDFK